MSETCAEFLIRRLSEWGIHRIYGYPGDGINGILGALDRAKDRMEFIQVRHEEMAAFMACAHAKFTDEVGVCLATSGPGAIHLLNGLYDARMDHVPVLAAPIPMRVPAPKPAHGRVRGVLVRAAEMVSEVRCEDHRLIPRITTTATVRWWATGNIAFSMRERDQETN
jgi:pyruvate dehydrogenase (quinone)